MKLTLLFALSVLTFSTSAFAAVPYVNATSSACVTYRTSTYGAGTYNTTCSNANGSNPNASSALIAPKVMRAAVSQTADMISDRLAAFAASSGGASVSSGTNVVPLLASDKQGVNASMLSVWSALGIKNLNDDITDGYINTVMAGLDFRLSDRLLSGLAIAYESTDLDTGFNDGEFKSDAFTIAPYGIYKITDQLSVDSSIGYSRVNYDFNRINGTVTSSTDADRIFAALNFNYNYALNRIRFGTKAGYLYAVEKPDDFTESTGTTVSGKDIYLGQARIGARIGYMFDRVEPFIDLRYEYDNVSSDIALSNYDDDRDGVVAALGLNFSLSSSVTGSILGRKELGRSNGDETHALLGNIAYKF